MRVTKPQLTKKEATTVTTITEEKHEAVNPRTKSKVSVDFSKDLFSLFGSLSPYNDLKANSTLDAEISEAYIKRRFKNYFKVQDHFYNIKDFFNMFSQTRLYKKLQDMKDPEEALRTILDMFSPPPEKPKGGKGKGDDEDGDNKDEEGEGQQGEGQGQEGEGEQGEGQGEGQDGDGQQGQGQDDKDSQDGGGQGQSKDGEDGEDKDDDKNQDKKDQEKEEQNQNNSQSNKQDGGSGNSKDSNDTSQGEDSNPDGQKPNQQDKNEQQEEEEMDDSEESEMSDSMPDLPMDLDKFDNALPEIEEALENDIMDDDILRQVAEKQSGTAHNSLKTLGGLQKHIKEVSNFINGSNFKILDIARKFGITEEYKRDEEIADVVYPEKDWRVTNMKNMTDLPKVLPYQFLYPDEIFDKMLIDRDLKIKQYQSRRKKKQVLYLLIDASGSMNPLNQAVANGIAVAYIRKAISEQSTYFFRFFDTNIFDLHTVNDEETAVKEIDYLLSNQYSGGGTSIDHALQKAIEDINNSKLFKQDKNDGNKEHLYDRADILIITDGADQVNVTEEFLAQNKVVLHSFLLEQDNAELKKISKTYQKLDNSQMTKLLRK